MSSACTAENGAFSVEVEPKTLRKDIGSGTLPLVSAVNAQAQHGSSPLPQARARTDVSLVQVHKSCIEHIREIFSTAMVVAMISSLVSTLVIASTLSPNFQFNGKSVPPWQAYVVGNVVVWGIVLMVQGYRSDFVLSGILCAFGLFGIVDKKNGLEGFMNQGNLTQCLLFVIVYAVEQAGVLEGFAFVVLGRPGNMCMALFRLILSTQVASAFLASPAVATVMTPITIGWATRLGLDHRQLLLPMAISGTFGGCLLLVGNGPALVAQDPFKKVFDIEITMFTTTPVSFILLVFFLIWATTVGQFFAPKANGTAYDGGERTGLEELSSRCYKVVFCVHPDCFLAGYEVGAVGLDRLPQVRILCVKDELGLNEATRAPDISAWKLQVNDKISAQLTARGMATLRRVRGIRLKGAEAQVRQLGGERHKRQLIEAIVHPRSKYINRDLMSMWSDNGLVSEAGAAFLAVRRTSSSISEDDPLIESDVLLLEADRKVLMTRAGSNFGAISLVPDSQPPRDRPLDRLRGYIVISLLILMVGASALKTGFEAFAWVPDLIYLTMFVCFACVAMQALTPAEALCSVKVKVFLVIGSAFGVGKAMETSGFARAAASAVVQVVESIFGSGSIYGSMIGLGFVTALLSNLMSNSATCVLMAPIAIQIVEDGNFQHMAKAFVLMLLSSASMSFATPIATPPNMIVTESEAKYTWGEFFKYGFPLQVLILPLTVSVILALYSHEEPLPTNFGVTLL